jgi:hypothetical protein
MPLRVALSNTAGELGHRIVKTQEEAKAAALEIINEVPHLDDGDKISVTETDETDGA